MSIASKLSGHWTDEEIIAHLYGVGPDNGHLQACLACQARFAGMQQNRHMMDAAALPGSDISSGFLAAQRRAIYSRLSERARAWSGIHVRRWVPAFATLLLLGSGAFLYEQTQAQHATNRISDAQLAQELSQLSADPDPQPAAPLQALFEQ